MASPRCSSCTDTGTKACMGCHAIKYCSLECQQADWPFHKTFYKLHRDLSPRPSEDHALAVFFPKDAAKPEFVLVEKFYLDRERFADGKILKDLDFRENFVTGARLQKPIFVYFDDDFDRNYKTENAGINLVAANKNTRGWRGPVVVVCRWGDHYDMDMLACSDLAAFFVGYWNNTQAHHTRQFLRGMKIEAVKATCPGEQALSGAATYVTVQVPVMHPILEDGMPDISEISKAIDMPLITWQYKPNPSWPDVPLRECNQKFCHMHKGIDPTVAGRMMGPVQNTFGFSSFKWDFIPGNVLVIRLDGEPITPEEVDAFGDFCLLHLTQYFQLHCERDGDVSEARMGEICDMIVAEATPVKWQAYLSDWRKIKAGITDDAEVNGRVDGKVRMGVTAEDADKLKYYLLCTHH